MFHTIAIFLIKLIAAGMIAGLAQSTSATDFLDHDRLLSGIDDPAWFKQNIGMLDTPDQELQDVYYYRWQMYREHIYYTSPQYGYILTEFLGPVYWAGPYGGIAAAAGHHINEGRWLRDQKPVRDYINYWLNGPGLWPKDSSHNWAHDYSFWAASSIYNHFLTTGDLEFVAGHFQNLVAQYRGWDDHFNTTLGLYWQIPDRDGTEQSAAAYETGHGPGYRPTINSYQYGDAKAIAALAKLLGRTDDERDYSQRADAIQKAMETYLWDEEAKFFKHMASQNNPNDVLVQTREIMGYLPWMFGMALDDSYQVSFDQLSDPSGFKSDFGPLTAENRSSLFMQWAYDGCCHWNGPSWPYATSQTLTAMENLLHKNGSRDMSQMKDEYLQMLTGYIKTHFRNGSPYIAEGHDPYRDYWMYDIYNRSEDYNHSTFIDNIIAGLIGLRSQSTSQLIVNPLIPSSWAYFGLENVPYHGHDVTVLWDRDGSHYGQGPGLTIWVDGQQAGNRADLGPLTVFVGETITQAPSTDINVAVNSQKYTYGTQPSSSYVLETFGDNNWGPIDGLVLRAGIPQNTRWTTWNSPNSSDWYQVDLKQNQSISKVVLYFFDDNGGVRVPNTFDLQYLLNGAFISIPQQSRPGVIAGNAETIIKFSPVMTSQLRVVAPNTGGGVGWGLSEFQVWVRPIYWLQNVNSGMLMGVQQHSTGESIDIQQSENDGSLDHRWEFVPTHGGWHKIVNQNSKKVLAVNGASTSSGAVLQQFTDTGSEDHMWRVEDNGKGQFVIRNKNSKLVVGVDQDSSVNGAKVVQLDDNGSLSSLWYMLPATAF